MTPPTSLTLSETMNLVRDYDGRIDTIWNIYIGGISLILAAVSAKTWRPRGVLLAVVFGVFAAGNLWALSRYYNVHTHLIEHAESLAGKWPLLSSLRLPSVLELIVFHLLLDVLVVIALVYLTKKAGNAAAQE